MIADEEVDAKVRAILVRLMFCNECKAAIEHMSGHLLKEARSELVVP